MTTIDVLVRVASLAGSSYLTWTWMDDAIPRAHRLDHDRVTRALDRLADALVTDDEDGPKGRQLAELLRAGAFSAPASELALSADLSDALLPPDLVGRIRDLASTGWGVRFRVTPTRHFARVPWELLVVDPRTGRRLIEDATVVLDPPTTVHVERSRHPASWSSVAVRAPVYVVDPELPRAAHLAGMLPALADPDDRVAFEDRIDDRRRIAGGELPGTWAPVQGLVHREDLGRALRAGPSRLFYFGHVSANVEAPGSAALHLSDEVAAHPGSLRGTVGLAEPLGPRRRPGPPRRIRQGDHLPLCALDLVLGTTTAAHGPGAGTVGALLWPMPPRVALIACEGGVDYRSSELFGLVMAMLDAGAGMVTSTRWVLPTDEGMRSGGGLGGDERPVIAAALAVDEAHEADDPVAWIRRWQIEKLEAWRVRGRLSDSPLVWATLATTVADARTSTAVSRVTA